MTKKLLRTSTLGAYVAPECDIFEVEPGDIICQSDIDALTIIDAPVEDWGELGDLII